jgi:hypothetical protein
MTEPGIHHGVPFTDYRRWDALSQSALKDFARSPGYYLWRQNNPIEPTPAMVMGSAIDSLLFEPDVYARDFVSWPNHMGEMPDHFVLAPTGYTGRKKDDKDWRARQDADGKVIVKESDILGGLSPLTAAGKAWKAWAEREGKRVLSQDEQDRVRGAVFAVQDYAPAAAYLQDETCRYQPSLFWEDDTGLTLKGRPDAITDTALIDLKSTENAAPEAFERILHAGRYHWQAAMYRDGLEALGQEIDECVLIVVERDPPHRVEVYRLDDSALELGRDEYCAQLRAYADCLKHDCWPLSTGSVQPIGVPAWAWK